jgi:large subunit ribosomal protein L15
MKMHELRPAPGATHPRKRVGRGLGSGHGKTATRGTKGQGARTSVNIPRNFEGGQTKLAMRTPKLRGFKNRWKRTFAVVNLTRLNRFQNGTTVGPELLIEVGAIKDVRAGLKVLGAGVLRRSLTVRAHRFSAGAREKIERAGGTVAVIEVPAPPAKTKRAKNQPRPQPKPEAETPAPEAAAAEGPETAKPARAGKAEGKAKAEKTEGKAREGKPEARAKEGKAEGKAREGKPEARAKEGKAEGKAREGKAEARAKAGKAEGQAKVGKKEGKKER